MKSSKYRFVVLVIAIAQLLSLSTPMVQANPDDASTAQTETILSEECVLTPVLSAQKFTTDEQIELSFDNTDVVDYYYISDGITVTEESNGSMQFLLTATDEFGSIEVYAEYVNSDVAKCSLYTYKYGDTVYVSDVAKDQAWYDCMKEQYDTGLLTLDEWQEAYSVLSRTFVAKDETEINTSLVQPNATASNISMAASSDMTISGTLRWEVNAAGDMLPLRMTKVELYDDDLLGDRCIATGYTDSNGYYSFTFENADDWDLFESGEMDFFIRCVLESETFKVAPDWVITSYYYEIDIADEVHSGTTTGLNYYLPYDDSINVSKAVYVQQGMVVGQRFATAMGMITNNFIRVVYPSGIGYGDKTSFCWGNEEINCYSVIRADNYNDIDVLTHEYGHFVECSMGNYGSSLWDILTRDPTHWAYNDNFEDKDDKTFAMNLTWSEAWATAFAQIAQDFYDYEYTSIPGFADCTDGCIGRTYDNIILDDNSCEAQEKAVAAVLWDLFDDVSEDETHDNVSLGYAAWWALTTGTGTYTLTDFVNRIESLYPSGRGAIGEIMAHYHISPGDLRITNASSVSASVPPKLSWKVNGSINNPNNRFQVVFYDNYGNYIYEAPAVTSTQGYKSDYTYSVTTGVWEQVLKNYSGTVTINIAVRGYHTEDPVSGPYLSQYAPITVHIHAYQYVCNDTSSHTGTCACGNTITEDHTYDECVYKDARTHTATCVCGDQQILMHWIKESELTGGRYGWCADCGARIDLGNSFVPVGPMSVVQVSVNGSYILPNGIAVIVDADVEAYINGTLVFYNPDELPVTQQNILPGRKSCPVFFLPFLYLSCYTI